MSQHTLSNAKNVLFDAHHCSAVARGAAMAIHLTPNEPPYEKSIRVFGSCLISGILRVWFMDDFVDFLT